MEGPRDRTHVSLGDNGLSRRSFLALAAASAASASLAPATEAACTARGPYKGKLCFFSKPLPGVDWRRLAQGVRRMGFDGVDLTVRKGGHVKPERAAEDLPKAVAIIRGEGLDVPMITTALTSADDPTAHPILSTAGKLGIPFFKAGYYLYGFKDVRKELERAGEQFRGLVDLAKQCGIPISIAMAPNYISHVRSLGQGAVDLAFAGPSPYVKAHDQYQSIELLARINIEHDTGDQTVIVTSRNSPVQRLSDLKGKTFAFGDYQSFGSHFMPRHLLRQHGVSLWDLMAYDYVMGHDNVILAVVHGDFDAGAVRNDVYQNHRDRDDLRILAGPIAIPWDGCDTAGRALAPGIYLYRIEVHAQEPQVILRTLGVAY